MSLHYRALLTCQCEDQHCEVSVWDGGGHGSVRACECECGCGRECLGVRLRVSVCAGVRVVEEVFREIDG